MDKWINYSIINFYSYSTLPINGNISICIFDGGSKIHGRWMDFKGHITNNWLRLWSALTTSSQSTKRL